MRTFLETERLRLRPLTERDSEALLALDSDPEVMRYLTGRPTSEETLRTRVLPELLHHYACWDERGFWAAEERGSGAFLGWFELAPVEEDSAEEVELGYRLAVSAWGRGLATEGASALVDKGFGELGVARVTANTMVVNARSRRVLERVGLRLARYYTEEWDEPIPGVEHGEVEYALTREEWGARR
ncbi:GNAT family N-acetyltransferase [Streptomyces sedi]|uniref:GNAT family N-acetyltransferase n=1 Tax=Streptomyces sedi TaxID=555059 RepID=A0A5C4V1W2_9ACTN|nr:GNAT family N-acetyltransferase [Streptomyces sedi]TNM29932.1 GNAT family N-acetyltransferase [Streptomyces sedi]